MNYTYDMTNHTLATITGERVAAFDAHITTEQAFRIVDALNCLNISDDHNENEAQQD